MASIQSSAAVDARNAADPASPTSALARFGRVIDLDGDPELPVVLELVRELSSARSPEDVLSVFGQGVRSLREHDGYISLSTRDLPEGSYRITRVVVNEDHRALADSTPWLHPDRIDVHSGGFLGELIRTPVPKVVHDLRLDEDPVIGDLLRGYGSIVAIPLFDGGRVLNWAIPMTRNPTGIPATDVGDRVLQSNLVGGTVRRALLAQELEKAHEQNRKEIRRIADIQRSLLPSAMPAIPGVRLAASYKTFDHAGGDYYDFLPLRPSDGRPHDPEDPWGLLIADASGHGPAAAVMMAMLHAILHAYPHAPEGPAEVLHHANLHVCNKRVEGSFVTAFFGIYDPRTRRMRYACAGHTPPLLKQPGSGGAVSRLDRVAGLPLGVLEEATYEEAEQPFGPGQSVVLYTDGISEAFSPERTMFGVRGIESALRICTGEPACVVSSVGQALEVHQGGVRPHDDQTLVIMRIESDEPGDGSRGDSAG